MKGSLYKEKTNINGKVVVITGICSEIGKEIAIDLAKRDGKIYITGPSVSRGEEIVKEIKKSTKKENIFFLQLDLSSLESIRQFSKKFHELENKLNILILNHEVVGVSQSKTTDGFEMNIGVNHLGHFYLTYLLLDLLKNSTPSRIVVESSWAYKFGSINKDDLMSENSYSRIKAYCHSKLSNLLFVNELSKKLVGTGVTINGTFPGVVISEIIRHLPDMPRLNQALQWMGSQIVNTPKEGAQTTIFAAVCPDLENVSGKFYSNCKETRISDSVINDEVSCWLWKKSEELVGINNV